MARAKEALALRGYSNPSPSDIARVLQYADRHHTDLHSSVDGDGEDGVASNVNGSSVFSGSAAHHHHRYPAAAARRQTSSFTSMIGEEEEEREDDDEPLNIPKRRRGTHQGVGGATFQASSVSSSHPRDVATATTTTTATSRGRGRGRGGAASLTHSHSGVWAAPVFGGAIPTTPSVGGSGSAAPPHHRPSWNDSTAIDQPPSRHLRQRGGGNIMMGEDPYTAAGLSMMATTTPSMVLPTSARLQRCIRQYEKELSDLYARHPLLMPKEGSPYWPPPPSEDDDGEEEAEDVYELDHEDEEKHHLQYYTARSPPSSPQEQQPQQHPRRGTAHYAFTMPLRSPSGGGGVNASKQRGTANLIFGITGDPRYRFRDQIRERARHPNTASRAPLGTFARRRRASSAGPGAAGGVRGGGVHDGIGIGSYTSDGFYVDPTGSTLRRKADPVKRGEQMRTLWGRDRFLTQKSCASAQAGIWKR